MGKKHVRITQEANFPWDGKVKISVDPGSAGKFAVKLRIPGWARNEAIPGGLYKFTETSDESFQILVNGEPFASEVIDGYAVVEGNWKPGNKIELELPMPVRKVIADERIRDDAGKISVQRGPVIFCAEWPDKGSGNVLNMVINQDKALISEFVPTLLGGTEVIKASGFQTKKTVDGKIETLEEEPLTLIPYALWNNRGPGQMMVWLPVRPEASKPLAAPTLAFRSIVKASKASKALMAVNDQMEPQSSNDRSVTYYHWWPDKAQWEFVQYDFEKPATISRTKVYWFDDGPDGGCRIPDEWEILYLSGNTWKPVSAKTKYTVTKDGWDAIEFKPVTTSSVKIRVKLNKEFSSGIYEWIVE
jgi:hypothetical protein